jgi:hypothetical protein
MDERAAELISPSLASVGSIAIVGPLSSCILPILLWPRPPTGATFDLNGLAVRWKTR